DAPDRARHRDHRPRPVEGRPGDRDRGHRAGEPDAHGPHLPHAARPRARRAGGEHARPRLHGGDAARQAEVRGAGGGVPPLPRRRADRRAQRALRLRLPRRRTAAREAGQAGPRAHDRQPGLGEEALPRHAEQPGRAVPPLRHRQLDAHQPQRAARRSAPGAGLPGTDGRPATRPHPRHHDRRAGHGGARRRHAATGAAADRARRGGTVGARGLRRKAEGPALVEAAFRGGV
ncbi:MAG: DNA polymerase III epsilon subunit, partial [uncultured Acetobacteraceae bacterium]